MRRNIKYSVLLLRPDYMTDNYGTDTYYTYVSAPNVKAAAAKAKLEAARVDENVAKPEDYATLLVLKGHLECELNPDEF